MCYVISDRGLALLRASDSIDTPARTRGRRHSGPGDRRRADQQRLRRARHEVHVAGWVLALIPAKRSFVALRGHEQAALSPPTRSVPGGRVAIVPPIFAYQGAASRTTSCEWTAWAQRWRWSASRRSDRTRSSN